MLAPVLKEIGITVCLLAISVIPTQMEKLGMVLPVLDSDSKEKKALLSAGGGLYPLFKFSSKKQELKIHSCGDERAVPWELVSKQKKLGIFVVIGEIPAELKISWVAAKKVDIKPPKSGRPTHC